MSSTGFRRFVITVDNCKVSENPLIFSSCLKITKCQLHKLTLPVNLLLYQLHINVSVTEHSLESFKVLEISCRGITIHSGSKLSIGRHGKVEKKWTGVLTSCYLIFADWPTHQILNHAIFLGLSQWFYHHYVFFNNSFICCRGRMVRRTSVWK